MKKKIIIFGLLLIAFLALIYFFILKEEVPKKSLITETKSILKTDIKNLHWLNSQELAFTFFDPETRRLALAKTTGVEDVVLLRDPKLKFSEVFWSSKNDLLIFEYGTPYTTYLYDSRGKLSQLPVTGYGFSWSPKGESFFYQPEAENVTVEPKIYHLSSKSEEPVGFKLPAFNSAFWSPNPNLIALYNFDLETDAGELSIADLNTKSIKVLNEKQALFPSWNPEGNMLSFSTKAGLFVFNGEEEKLIYPSNSTPHFISHIWLNNDQILILDLDLEKKVLIVNIRDGSSTQVNILPELQTEQDTEMNLSPDKETLAVAGEKDGLWFVKTKDFLQD